MTWQMWRVCAAVIKIRVLIKVCNLHSLPLFLSSGHIKSHWSCEWPLIAGNVTAVRVKSGPKTHPDDSKTVTDISSSRLPTGRISPRLKFHQQAVGATKVDLSKRPIFLSFLNVTFFRHNIFYHINNIQSDGKIVVIRLPVMASPTLPSQVPEQVSNLAPFCAQPLKKWQFCDGKMDSSPT